jgi:hypothetical protein
MVESPTREQKRSFVDQSLKVEGRNNARPAAKKNDNPSGGRCVVVTVLKFSTYDSEEIAARIAMSGFPTVVARWP